MDLVALTEYLVKSIVVDEEAVSVKEFDSEDDNTILIQVMVADEDMGRVIGKNGKSANAIRTLVQASSALALFPFLPITLPISSSATIT